MGRILGLIILFALASCTTNGSSRSPVSLEVATYDQRSHEVTSFRKELFRTTFRDGGRIDDISVERHNGDFYLIRQGVHDPARPTRPSCRTDSLRLSDDGRGHLSIGSSPPVWRLCTGNNCARCGYLFPGCLCLESIDKLASASCTVSTMNIGRTDLLNELVRDAAQ